MSDEARADYEELVSDVNHVLAQLERLITSDLAASDSQERMAGLVQARKRVANTSNVNVLTDVLTWSLAQLEREEARAPASRRKEAEKNLGLSTPKELIMGRTGWSIHAAPNGKAYWHNERSGESVWVEPEEVVRYRLATEVDGWGVHPAPNGRPYWHNEETGESVWKEPRAMMDRRIAYMNSIQSMSSSKTDDRVDNEGKSKEMMADSSDESENISESKNDAGSPAESKTGDVGQRIDEWEKMAIATKDPAELKRVLQTTFDSFKDCLSKLHDITQDRDALVDAIHKMSAEHHDEIEGLSVSLKDSKAKVKKLKKKLQHAQETKAGEDGGETPNIASLQDGLEAALKELKQMKKRNRELEDENEELRKQRIDGRSINNMGSSLEQKSERDANSEGPESTPKKERPKRKKKRKSKRSNRKSSETKDRGYNGADDLVQSHILMGKSASVVQSHMRGFLARKQLQQKIDEHLDEDVYIPDYGHLDEFEPKSPLLIQSGMGSNRKTLRK